MESFPHWDTDFYWGVPGFHYLWITLMIPQTLYWRDHFESVTAYTNVWKNACVCSSRVKLLCHAFRRFVTLWQITACNKGEAAHAALPPCVSLALYMWPLKSPCHLALTEGDPVHALKYTVWLLKVKLAKRAQKHPSCSDFRGHCFTNTMQAAC